MLSEGIMTIRQTGAFADAGKLPADAPGRFRTIVDIRDDSGQKGKNGCRSRSDKCNGRALARRLIKLVSNQKPDTEADRGLRKRNNAGHREVVAKFIE